MPKWVRYGWLPGQRLKKRKYAKLYGVWTDMRKRCNSECHPRYHDYGGRGIYICEEWGDYSNFRHWAINSGYRKGLQLDRIDNDKGYSPDNCRWATAYEQCFNKRSTITVEYNGEEWPISVLARRFGRCPNLIRSRYKIGWRIEDALREPRRR